MSALTMTKRELFKAIYGYEPTNSNRKYSRHTTNSLRSLYFKKFGGL